MVGFIVGILRVIPFAAPGRSSLSRRVSCRPKSAPICPESLRRSSSVAVSASTLSLWPVTLPVERLQVFAEQIEANIERILSWNPSFSLTLIFLVFVLVLFIGSLLYLFTSGEIYHNHPHWQRGFWRTWEVLSGTSYYNEEEKPTSLLLLTILAFLHFLIFAILIGSVTETLHQRVAQIDAGHTRILDRDHLLVIGWNPSVFEYLRQLDIYTSISNRRRKVVLLSEVPKKLMLRQLQENLGSETLRRLSLLCRNGDITDRRVLERVGVHHAKEVVLFSSEGVKLQQTDAFALKTLLMARSLGCKAPFVIECHGQRELFESVDENLTVVDWEQAVSLVAAMEVVQPAGFHYVMEEVLSYDGMEFHITEYPEVTGMRFHEASRYFPTAVLCGLYSPDSEVTLAPPPHHTIAKGEKLVFLAANRFVEYSEVVKDQSLAIMPGVRRPPRKKITQEVLIAGWREGMLQLLKLIDLRAERGTKVTILSETPRDQRIRQLREESRESGINQRLRNLHVEHIVGSYACRADVNRLANQHKEFHSCLILMDDDGIRSAYEPRLTDSHALNGMTLLRSIIGDRIRKMFIEVLDPTTGYAIDSFNTKSVSVYFISMVETFARTMAQASLQPAIYAHRTAIFAQKHGDGIGIHTKEDVLGEDYHMYDNNNFWNISTVAAKHGFVIIGFQTTNDRITLNPQNKDEEISMDNIKSFVTVQNTKVLK